jgi:hypothetical protein
LTTLLVFLFDDRRTVFAEVEQVCLGVVYSPDALALEEEDAEQPPSDAVFLS